MTQIINKDEVQETPSKKLTIKTAKNIDQAKFELKKITDRTSGTVQDKAIKVVDEILKNVSERGDEALKEYTSRFDGFVAEQFQVPSDLILKAWEQTPKVLQDSLLLAKKRIEKFHSLQVPKNITYSGPNGESLGRRWTMNCKKPWSVCKTWSVLKTYGWRLPWNGDRSSFSTIRT